jgi:RNA polymerase sigma factor (sigma-70 family)
MSKCIARLTDQRSRFLAFLERKVRDRAEAEDILQAAYARAIPRADSVEAGCNSVEAWFFRILRNAVIDHYRHRAVEARSILPWSSEMEVPGTAPDPAPGNICGCITAALEAIPPKYREILHDVDLTETPLNSFARRVGITLGNASVRAHRARRALHKQLLDRCGSCARAGCLDCTCPPNFVPR